MIDIHCHLLPSIDDGAKNLETSLDMLRIAEGDGIKKIIATPHFYRGYYENEYMHIEEQVKKLNEEAKKADIGIQVFPGQEVFLDKYTVNYYKEGIIRGLNGSKYVLLELDIQEFSKDTLDIIYELRLLGVKPIIAHPERYIYVNKNLTILNSFIKEECLFQVNSSSLSGLFGKSVKKTAESLVEKGLSNFIATDAHSVGRRAPRLKEAFEFLQKNNSKIYKKINENTQKLLENVDIMYKNKEIEEKKSIFSVLFR